MGPAGVVVEEYEVVCGLKEDSCRSLNMVTRFKSLDAFFSNVLIHGIQSNLPGEAGFPLHSLTDGLCGNFMFPDTIQSVSAAHAHLQHFCIIECGQNSRIMAIGCSNMSTTVSITCACFVPEADAPFQSSPAAGPQNRIVARHQGMGKLSLVITKIARSATQKSDEPKMPASHLFSIPDLLELIFLEVAEGEPVEPSRHLPQDALCPNGKWLMKCQRVDRTFRAVIDGSRKIQRKLELWYEDCREEDLIKRQERKEMLERMSVLAAMTKARRRRL